MRKSLLFLLSLSILNSCDVAPEPIAYGSDGCHFCRMTIVDKQHAAEMVTTKGKTYKFDASECLLQMLGNFDEDKVALLLVNDYASPGSLTDATEATFLISANIPSPMGAFLSAFSSKEKAIETQFQHGGQLYSWRSLRERFENQESYAR